MENALTEIARAKINLTLKVRGRRADGYHDIESLVAFAGFGDTLMLAPGGETSLALEGEFAGCLDADNLVLRAAREWEKARGGVSCGAFRLTKRIPVAAGLGGGSADAGAALRLLVRASSGKVEDGAVSEIAEGLGADVPVCFASRPAIMSGIGERLEFVPSLPMLGVLLVNPGIAVPTARVFARLNAPHTKGDTADAPPPDIGTADALLAYMGSAGNDLESPALEIAPEIGIVKDAIAATPGCLAAAMSGSGATCFGLYRSGDEAGEAADVIGRAHPEWWLQSSLLESA